MGAIGLTAWLWMAEPISYYFLLLPCGFFCGEKRSPPSQCSSLSCHTVTQPYPSLTRNSQVVACARIRTLDSQPTDLEALFAALLNGEEQAAKFTLGWAARGQEQQSKHWATKHAQTSAGKVFGRAD